MLAELGIEGEYCQSAVDAVERVTTQMFQIVITDWDDQPEAAFLLKTARDLKAAVRPLTLAIVGEDARLPEALQAGANSVLVKPIRTEQVRDTMSTACELLRARLAPTTQQAVPAAAPMAYPGAMAAAASESPAATASGNTVAVEKTFRAGEFLQSPGAAPGRHFDTECEVQKSLDQAAGADVDALNELEPMASSVAVNSDEETIQPPAAPTGWTSLQERLARAAPQKAAGPLSGQSPKRDVSAEKFSGNQPSSGDELVSFSEASPYSPVQQEAKSKVETNREPRETGEEAALFDYMDGKGKEAAEPAENRKRGAGKVLLFGLLTTAVLLVSIPQTRQRLQIVFRRVGRAGKAWLNPQPNAVSAGKLEHESFAHEGDEYKLPAQENVPDATADTTLIRVLPVVDPTAKPPKGAEGAVASSAETVADSSQQSVAEKSVPQVPENPATQASTAVAGNGQQDTGTNLSPGLATTDSALPIRQTAEEPAAQTVPAPQAAPRVHLSTPASPLVASTTAIPTSLRSQIATMTPEASGAKPVEAAMSSIEPVNLPEATAWSLLAEPVDPVYPDSAKSRGQRGSVMLQVLIGRDGTVQDAKFLQGSLVFARAAIEAVKQWHFKPYSLNGRAVSVQSAITLNFKPPA